MGQKQTRLYYFFATYLMLLEDIVAIRKSLTGDCSVSLLLLGDGDALRKAKLRNLAVWATQDSVQKSIQIIIQSINQRTKPTNQQINHPANKSLNQQTNQPTNHSTN